MGERRVKRSKFCEICGKAVPKPGKLPGADAWRRSIPKIVEISGKKGHVYGFLHSHEFRDCRVGAVASLLVLG
jgi:hypothetical protein